MKAPAGLGLGRPPDHLGLLLPGQRPSAVRTRQPRHPDPLAIAVTATHCGPCRAPSTKPSDSSRAAFIQGRGGGSAMSHRRDSELSNTCRQRCRRGRGLAPYRGLHAMDIDLILPPGKVSLELGQHRRRHHRRVRNVLHCGQPVPAPGRIRTGGLKAVGLKQQGGVDVPASCD